MHKQVNLQLRLTLSIQGWQCWDGFAHPGLAWWVSLSKGTSLAPLSNTSRVPQDFGEHYSSQRSLMMHQQLLFAPLAVNYSPELWSKPVTSGNCADPEQTD